MARLPQYVFFVAVKAPRETHAAFHSLFFRSRRSLPFGSFVLCVAVNGLFFDAGRIFASSWGSEGAVCLCDS